MQPSSHQYTGGLLPGQVRGRRRVLLMPPAHAHKGLYAFPVHHPYDATPCLIWDTPDPGRLARAGRRAGAQRPAPARGRAVRAGLLVRRSCVLR